MSKQKKISKPAVILACLASLVTISTNLNGLIKPGEAQTLSNRCQKYGIQLTNAIYQTDTEIAASKVQVQDAEERAKQLMELSQAGAVSQSQVNLAQVQVKKAKKDLAAAIARSKQVKQQLTTLQNMPACTV
jgi:multidrug resistance efflux pump